MSYRDVASKQVLVWACTSVGARMPVAMAPLALTLVLTAIGWWGEVRRARRSSHGADTAVMPGTAAGGPVAALPGTESTAIRGGCDPQECL